MPLANKPLKNETSYYLGNKSIDASFFNEIDNVPDSIPGTNILIVDGGGNGDYTTISEACAYITASGNPSATNRWTVLLTGPVTETAAFNLSTFTTVQGLGKQRVTFTGSQTRFNVPASGDVILKDFELYTAVTGGTNLRAIAANMELTIDNVDYTGGNSMLDLNFGVTYCRVYNCRWTQTWNYLLEIGNVSGEFTFKNCEFYPAGQLNTNSMSNASADLTMIDCEIRNSAHLGGSALMTFNGSVDIYMKGCRFDLGVLSGWNDLSLSFSSSPGTVFIKDCSFEGEGTAGAVESYFGTWANAPFYNCRFVNGVSNITFEAGNTTNF